MAMAVAAAVHRGGEVHDLRPRLGVGQCGVEFGEPSSGGADRGGAITIPVSSETKSTSTGPVLVLESRARIRKLLVDRRAPGWRRAGIDRSWWGAFAWGQIEVVPLPLWRTVVSWYPGLSRAIGAAL